MYVDRSRLAEACTFQHGRPEQGMEVDDILADKVIQLGTGARVPEGVKAQFGAAAAEVLEAGHVADRRVQPDVEVLAGLAWNLKAEVGSITADVPLLQAAVQPFGNLVGHGVLQGAAAGPLLQHVGKILQTEEEVLGVLEHRCGAGNGRARVFQLGRLVGGAAFFAVVAVLIFSRTLGAGALDETVGQEHALFRVKVLGNRAGADVTCVFQTGINQFRELTIFFRVRGVKVVEVDKEIGKIAGMLGMHVGNQLFRGEAFLLGAQHDG